MPNKKQSGAAPVPACSQLQSFMADQAIPSPSRRQESFLEAISAPWMPALFVPQFQQLAEKKVLDFAIYYFFKRANWPARTFAFLPHEKWTKNNVYLHQSSSHSVEKKKKKKKDGHVFHAGLKKSQIPLTHRPLRWARCCCCCFATEQD